jgi:integrase/recombinase XerD
VRYLPLHPGTAELVSEYVEAAEHGSDPASPLFRPVKNNRTGLLAKPLNPQSLYESIVLHYAKKVGITDDTHGFCVHSLRATAATNSLSERGRYCRGPAMALRIE